MRLPEKITVKQPRDGLMCLHIRTIFLEKFYLNFCQYVMRNQITQERNTIQSD